MKRLLLGIAFLCMCSLQAQNLPDNVQLWLEEVAEENEELDVSEIVLLLQRYAEQPINLNICSKKELEQFPLINEQQAQAILTYRNKKGNFSSLFELQAIRVLDMKTIRLIIPFFTIEEKTSVVVKNIQHQLMMRYQQLFQKQKGYTENEYQGLALKNDWRYQGKSKNVDWGALTEKDAGENFFDFNSAYLHLSPNTKWEVLLGDYEVRMGQGLLIRQGLSMGKSSEVMNIRKGGPILRPHRSVTEYGYLRGVAAQYHYGNWNLSTFTSYNKIDANIVDTVDGELIASSYLQDGLHRTENDLADKNRLTEQLVGTQWQFQKGNFQWEIAGLYATIEGGMEQPTAAYELFDNQNSEQWGLSTAYSYTWKNAYFFGEWAKTNQSWAYLNGMLLYLAPKLSFSALHRNYPKEFDFRYAQAFSENTKLGNEKGLYLGMEFQPFYKWRLKAYADYYEFPWLKFGVDAPSSGRDYLCHLEYYPSKKWNMYFRWKREDKQGNEVDEFGLNDLIWNKKQSWRWQVQYSVGDFKFKNRVEWSQYNESNGYLLLQDVRYKPLESKWSATMRYALFETADYDSRIYAYEPDVLYAFSVPAHYGSGQRYLLVFKYRFYRKLSAWIRLSETTYFDRTSVKSGWEEIDGNKVTEVKVQLRYKF